MRSARSILEADHAELHSLLDKSLTAIRDADLDLAYAATDLFWARLAMHIRAEHLHLFPFVRAAHGEAGPILDQLRSDHDIFMIELGRAIKALRLAFDFGNIPETLATVHALVARVAERLAVHDEIEEQQVYPFVRRSEIPEEKMASLCDSIQQELRNYPQRLRKGGNKKAAD